MKEFADRHCQPCKGDESAMTPAQARAALTSVAAHWRLSADGRSIECEFKFSDFYHTMSFVNALAHIANTEDHHPDLQLGYNYCRVRYSTHSVGGLSDNDFICAAKIDRLRLS